MAVKELLDILDGNAGKRYAWHITYGKRRNIPGIDPIIVPSDMDNH
jgi:hypothetical protein